MKKPRAQRTALSYACWLLGRREYTQHELRQALVRKQEFAAEEIEAAVTTLHDRGWQSDARAATMLVGSGTARRYGPTRILAMARTKGLETDLIEQALESSETDWRQAAVDAVQRKFGSAPFSREIQIKVAHFLARKGYSLDIAWAVAQGKNDE